MTIDETKDRIRMSKMTLISRLCDGGELIQDRAGQVIGEVLGYDVRYDEPTLVIAWGDDWERERRKHLEDISAYDFLRNLVGPPERAETQDQLGYDS
jgi:hypothetical protein